MEMDKMDTWSGFLANFRFFFDDLSSDELSPSSLDRLSPLVSLSSS
jgi:hypothetical protein